MARDRLTVGASIVSKWVNVDRPAAADEMTPCLRAVPWESLHAREDWEVQSEICAPVRLVLATAEAGAREDARFTMQTVRSVDPVEGALLLMMTLITGAS